jgi:hypothetical protein
MLRIAESSHVSTQDYFVVGEPTLRVHCPEGAHAIDNETVIGDGCLESLQSIPFE